MVVYARGNVAIEYTTHTFSLSQARHLHLRPSLSVRLAQRSETCIEKGEHLCCVRSGKRRPVEFRRGEVSQWVCVKWKMWKTKCGKKKGKHRPVENGRDDVSK